MRAIWKGSISFGLVNIPIALFPATKTEDIKFRLLRDKDMSPVNYKRVAAADGKEVPWANIVKGYEHEKGSFVVLKDDDFKRVDIEATQTVDILSFVQLGDVNPVFFHKPYYMEPLKGADKAYVLLRDALRDSGKIGIAKVVIKTRQHLAAVKPQEEGLMLELMHYASELRDLDEFRQPKETQPSKRELDMAKALIKSMSDEWNPEGYQNEYRDALEEMIEEKIARGSKPAPKAKARKQPSNVIDLVAVLEESLRGSSSASAKTKKKTPAKKAAKKTTAKRTKKRAPAKKRSRTKAA
ncbi:Ku protein [Phragmitibacter flavus]|uniref:Non-homologous end joining protein Ku n=1 Tax=Phragmitibacter flavus TaxID=2576071 RepID=A0A5R8KJN4_9BACT|nr:Ku protein [Phragmitibacter flavus]TLD72524.1 Ku protein [Phragmitibacter flavus]